MVPLIYHPSSHHHLLSIVSFATNDVFFLHNFIYRGCHRQTNPFNGNKSINKRQLLLLFCCDVIGTMSFRKRKSRASDTNTSERTRSSQKYYFCVIREERYVETIVAYMYLVLDICQKETVLL